MSDYAPLQQNAGSYIATTTILDVAQLQSVDVNSPEFKELLVRLYQTVNDIALALNTKDSAFYTMQEFVNGQVFFNLLTNDFVDLRSDFRMVVNIGAVADSSAKPIAHNIAFTSTYTATRIYAAGTDSTGLNYYAIPYLGTSGNNISIDVTSTNVVITNNSGTDLTRCIAVIEYLKN